MTSFHQTGFLIDTFIIKLKSWRLLENITGSYIINTQYGYLLIRDFMN